MESNISMAKSISDTYKMKMSSSSITSLAEIIFPRPLNKNERFLDEGQISRNMGFIEQGLVRQFYYKNGKDITEHFSSEKKMFICIESFIKQEPTHLIAEALEQSVVWAIPHDPFYALIKNNQEIACLYQKILENSLIESQIKADLFRFETAHYRYERFLKLFPEPAKRAALQHIASFLLMTPETLSRVRAKLL